MQPVGALTADLDRRRGRDRQLDLAAEAREPRRELLRTGRLQLFHDVPLPVAGRRPGRQVDVGEVALVESHEARGQLSCRSGQHKQEPCRERIERSGVAGACTRPPPHFRNDAERGRPLRLVDQQDAARAKRPRRHGRIPDG